MKELNLVSSMKARFCDWIEEDDTGKFGSREKVAPKDFRTAHQKMLDEIKKKSKEKRKPLLSEIDITALFPLEDKEDAEKEVNSSVVVVNSILSGFYLNG